MPSFPGGLGVCTASQARVRIVYFICDINHQVCMFVREGEVGRDSVEIMNRCCIYSRSILLAWSRPVTMTRPTVIHCRCSHSGPRRGRGGATPPNPEPRVPEGGREHTAPGAPCTVPAERQAAPLAALGAGGRIRHGRRRPAPPGEGAAPEGAGPRPAGRTRGAPPRTARARPGSPLPAWPGPTGRRTRARRTALGGPRAAVPAARATIRSEERRVGKEC